ncbi:hypothetical protein U1Q18_051786, partial [Sarracenia purpurea var. burkii]
MASAVCWFLSYVSRFWKRVIPLPHRGKGVEKKLAKRRSNVRSLMRGEREKKTHQRKTVRAEAGPLKRAHKIK